MNEGLGLNVGEAAETLEEKRRLRTLQQEDVVAVVRELEALRLGLRPVDDIDHLGIAGSGPWVNWWISSTGSV